MKANKHPDPSTILAYAAGAVTESFSLLIAAHVESCPECREAVLAAEALGGQLVDRLPPAEMPNSGLDAIWERITAEPEEIPMRTRSAETWGLPRVLAPFIPGGLETVHWRNLVPGIKQHLLADVESGQGTVRLLSIAADTKIPHHTHLGSELTLVLQGSYCDETGHYRPGDLADLDSSVTHQPVVDSDQACICLIATDQRLKFTGALNRMLQPLVGI